MGKMDNKYDTLCGGDLKIAMKRCSLIVSGKEEESYKNVLRRYIIEQLVYLPGGSQQFDHMCIDAKRVLHNVIVNGTIPLEETPPVLQTSLVKRVNDNLFTYRNELQTTLCDTLISRLNSVNSITIPSRNAILNATLDAPIHNQIQIQHDTNVQNCESYTEQQKALELIDKTLQQYVSGTKHQVKSVCIIGGPGCGKTFCGVEIAGIKAMSRGLTTMSTALMAERALSLGGRHIHKWSHVQPNKIRSIF